MNENSRVDKQNISDLERARLLRQEAEMLEYKGRVRSRLEHLMEISKDPYYDQYLAQMLRDLDSGRATPAQVDREAQRSYNQYKQRMEQQAMAEVHARRRQQAAENCKQQQVMPGKQSVEKMPEKQKNLQRTESAMANTNTASQSNMEFKIGVHVFSFVGAAFILSAFVIFGFNFLSGLAQGLCLYGAALVLVVLSELLLGKKIPAFSHVLTGIGVGGLYAANIVNLLVLHTINGIAAMIITLLIAVATLFFSRKKESATIRVISLAGCYISFLPVKGFGTEFNFLISIVILFVINTVSIFFNNQKKQVIIDSVHIFLNVLFTVILTSAAWAENLNPAYMVFYVLTSFVFGSILYLRRNTDDGSILFIFSCIGNGAYIFLLFLIGYMAPGVSDPDIALFVHLLSEVLIVAVCGVIFLLWDKEDNKRWAQIYYMAGAVLLLSSFSEYHLERILSILIVLLLAKLLAGQKEMQVLDCIAVTWTGLMGLWLSDYWYCWLFAGALFLSILRIKSVHIYHEIVITLSILAIWWSQCEFYLHREFSLDRGWLYPVSVGILLLLFLIFNHLPRLKAVNQKPYNITNIIFMVLYYLSVWFCDSYIFSSIMMVLGAVTIIVVFRKRYGMAVPRKYLLLAGFLVYFSITGHYESPVIVSILLMIISLGCVGIGFKLQDKIERVCGLVMALIVCMKLVIYDFREVETIYRMIVFLVVGVIALIISYIYIQLEKNIERKKERESIVSEQTQMHQKTALAEQIVQKEHTQTDN